MVPLPKVGSGRSEPKRRPAKKVPSLHLTGEESMKYIAEADARTKAKVAKEDKIKKEAVKSSRAAERKMKKKMK